MQTIGQALGNQAVPNSRRVDALPEGNIGIELELESPRSFRDVNGWERKPDGSLRDGVEYVFEGPAGGEVALQRILNMGEYLSRNQPEPTFRCSTHIHLDVRDLTFIQYDRLVAAYALFEHVLFDHCSPYRRYSNFCTPFFINDRMLEDFQRGFRGAMTPERKLYHLGGWPKYSALNLKVTQQYGSVEFRGSHALTTSEELLGLAQRMLHIRRLVVETAADSNVAFIEALRTMTLSEAFPQGLNTGYAQDPDHELIGYSNALLVASGAWNYDESGQEPSIPRARSSSTRGGGSINWMSMEEAAQTSPRPPRPPLVEINRSTFDMYNIDSRMLAGPNSTTKYLSAVLDVYVSLQNIVGLVPPSLGDLLSPSYVDTLVRDRETLGGLIADVETHLNRHVDIMAMLASNTNRPTTHH